MKQNVYLKLACIIMTCLIFTNCKKELKSTTSTPVSASKADSAKSKGDKATFATVSNCGIAVLPNPPADAHILQPGIILQTFAIDRGPVPGPPPTSSIPSERYFGQWNQYRLAIRRDGNLVVEVIDRGPNGTMFPPNIFSIWESKSGSPSAIKDFDVRVQLQVDGNLVIRANRPGEAEIVFWMSDKTLCANQWPPILLLQTDGNVVEEYKCAQNGNNTYGHIGNTGTDGGDNSGHWGRL